MESKLVSLPFPLNHASTRLYVMPKRSAQLSGNRAGVLGLSGQHLATSVLMSRCQNGSCAMIHWDHWRTRKDDYLFISSVLLTAYRFQPCLYRAGSVFILVHICEPILPKSMCSMKMQIGVQWCRGFANLDNLDAIDIFPSVWSCWCRHIKKFVLILNSHRP